MTSNRLWMMPPFKFRGKAMEEILETFQEWGNRGLLFDVGTPVLAIERDSRSPMEVLEEKLAGRKKVTRQQIKAWVEEMGRAGTGFAYYVKQLSNRGLIRAAGKRGEYDVTTVAKTKKRKA